MDGIAVKQCASCKQVKPHSEFWRQKTGSDKVHSYCKVCSRAARRRSYPRMKSTEHYKESHRISSRRYLAAHPEVGTAHNKVHKKKATLKKTECERCGTSGCLLHMHHPDHAKPFQVITLCVPCHEIAHHGELK
jgi:hypothetical protein